MVDNFAFADLPDEVIGFRYPLPPLALALQTQSPLKIVAMGSSSTAGRDDVVPYPYRLQMYLRAATGNAKIDVLNRGKGGEEAVEELPRFDADIFDEAPSLCRPIQGVGATIMRHLPDHGLPLIQLKEQRRDLVVALQNRHSPVSAWELMQIAAVQQAISAFEDVIADLDAEMEAAA